MPIRAVVFDLDQTLIDRDKTFQAFLEQQYQRLELALRHVDQASYISTVMRYDENGYVPKSEVFTSACRDLGLSDLPEALLADYRRYYGFDPVLFDDVHQVLFTLKQHYLLGLITNGRTIGQNAKIDNADIRKYFQNIKISEEEGVKKPDARIFERCLRDLRVMPQQAIFVGDHPENDIMAAKRCGMMGIWMKNPHYPQPEEVDGVVSALNEVIDSIQELNNATGEVG
jgi:putative hydrolase of the HAD superfamily